MSLTRAENMRRAQSMRTTTNRGMRYAPRTEAYERLALDGGWLTPAQLAMECGMAEASVQRTLDRQVAAGWVERRSVELATLNLADPVAYISSRLQLRPEVRVEYRVRQEA